MIKLFLPVILIVGIVGGVYLVQNRVNLFPRADEKPFQEKVIVSNLAPTSLSITYFTKTATYDFLQYGENTDIPNVALDKRIKEDGLNPQLFTHYFSIKNLKPNTKYYFKINSNGVLLPENEYLTFQTPARLRGRPSTEIFSGSVKKIENGEVPAESIIFLSSENGQLLSAPMKESGEWRIGFNGVRNADLSGYLNLIDTDLIKFMAYAGRDGFGLFGEYALRKSDIVITVDEGRVPFYKIDVTNPDSSVSASRQGESNIIWVTVSDFLKGVF